MDEIWFCDKHIRLPWVLALLVLQINRDTLSNLVVNFPLERLSYYLTWQIDQSRGIWLPPSLSPAISSPCLCIPFSSPFHLVSFFSALLPFLMLSWGNGGVNGGSTTEYRSGISHVAGLSLIHSCVTGREKTGNIRPSGWACTIHWGMVMGHKGSCTCRGRDGVVVNVQ